MSLRVSFRWDRDVAMPKVRAGLNRERVTRLKAERLGDQAISHVYRKTDGLDVQS